MKTGPRIDALAVTGMNERRVEILARTNATTAFNKGRLEGRKEDARTMKKEGISPETIEKVTGLKEGDY